jgi:hypothetical protein
MNLRTRRATRFALAALLLASAAVAASAPEDEFAITGHVIAGGSGRAHNACFDLSGTAGQPSVGSASGGAWDVVSGFWAVRVERTDSLFRDAFEECQP